MYLDRYSNMFIHVQVLRKANVDMIICGRILQEVLKNLEMHRQTFQQIHRDRSVNGVPVPPEQLQDMAER